MPVKHSIFPFAALLLLLAALSNVAFAAESPYLGTWRWKSGPKAETTIRITKVDGEKVEGTLTAGAFGSPPVPAKPIPIENGALKDGVLTFTWGQKDKSLRFEAKLDGETLKGAFTNWRGRPQSFEAKRIEEKETQK
jgi:hypothetical protein